MSQLKGQSGQCYKAQQVRLRYICNLPIRQTCMAWLATHRNLQPQARSGTCCYLYDVLLLTQPAPHTQLMRLTTLTHCNHEVYECLSGSQARREVYSRQGEEEAISVSCWGLLQWPACRLSTGGAGATGDIRLPSQPVCAHATTAEELRRGACSVMNLQTAPTRLLIGGALHEGERNEDHACSHYARAA